MRPASSSAVKWMSVPAILLSILVFANIASAQSGKVSDEKLSQQALPAHPVAAIAQTQLPKNNLAKNNVAPPPVTTDTWNGGGGSNTDWSDAANWNNGAIGSGYNILINTSSAATTVDQSFTIGTLTLSNSGDSASLNNNVQLSLGGNVSNAGTITFNGNGNLTGFDVTTALTLSGSGTLVLAPGASANTDYIYGTGDTTFTNASKITGVGTIGNGQLNLVNSGTINANLSGDTLTINPDACTGCTSINTGTLESTNGGILTLSGSTWSNTGGTIAAGTGSAVNLQNNVTINGGTLTTSGTGVIYNDSGSGVFLNNVTNSGAYVMQNNGLTEISGTITNTGTMTVEGNGNTTGLYLTGNATLTGSGSVTLQNSGSATNYIYGVAGSVLTNQQTIQGVGNVGNGELMIANASKGIINANVSGATLTLQSDTALTSTNAGLLEATNGGVLTLNNGTWTNTGTIEAQTGSTVNLYSNVSITGGTIESTGAGVVNNVTGSDVFLTGLTLAGTYNVQNNAITEINGTITNNGTITLQGNGNLTGLYVTSAGTGSATLAGTGTVVMATGNGGNQIYGVGGTSLTIEENISGVGNIGAADLTLTNSATINANISPTVSTAPLYIQPGAGGMTNTGVLEATNGGNLTLDGGTFTNTGGTIEAVGSDSSNNPSTVVLTNNVGITGGTLTTTGAGVIEVASGNQANLTGLTISSGSLLNVINNGEINTNGTITNNGTITLEGAGNSTYLYAPTSTTLTGTGSVVLTSGNGSYTGIVETAGGQTLTNKETISGAGTIQEGSIVNNGTINANISGQTLTLYDFTAATNTKTMEASGGGTLAFDGSTWTNTGGTIAAVTGSAVDLYASTSITGGTLTTTGTGQIYIPGGNQANLTSLTISSGSVLNVNNNGELNTNGTITNNGTITLQGAGNSTYLYAPTSTTLTGTGSVVLTSTNGDYTGIVDTAGGQTLTNNETISGAGLIEGGNIANNGTINAGVNGETLTLYNFTTATNTKTLEATNGGTLAFEGSSWTQTGVGTMTAQTGSSIELYSNATISGGTLTTAGTGQFYVPGGNTAYLSNLTNSGTFNVENNAELELTGTITNNGSFNVSGNGNATYLLINGAVTLKGTGVISLGGTSYTNSIYGEGTAPILTSFNTIEGAGNLGSSNMGFTNDGTVDANIAGQAIAINVNSSGFTNYNGTTTTLTGGTYIANGGNITFAAGNATGITTLAATVVEEGGGQMLNTSNSSGNALANLTSITSAGSFTTNVNFADAGAFSNAGSLTILGSTTFKVGSLTQISAGSLTAGTYVLDSNLDITGTAQTITANAANLTLAGGTIENTSNSTNALAGLATNTGKLTLANNAAFATTAASFSNTGTLTVNAGSTFIAPALTQISGTTLSGGTWVLGGNIDLNSGISITANASTLTLEGGTINSGSTNALAGLDSNTRILTLADNANFTATAATFSNAGELVVNSGSTFTANALSQYKTSQNALSGGTFVIGGTLAFAAGANGIEVLSSNLTLEGTGNIKNTTNNSNALAGLNNIVAAGSFTLADDANFTTAANLTNSGKLIIDSGSTFSVAGTLSNLSGGTLTGGTYTVGGTLQLTSANGGITTNAAALTLSGTTAKILDGTGNALSTFNNNTGSLTLSADATLETAASTFTNSGTVDVAKGSTLEVGGTTFGYSQSAGTTTVDGTVIGKGTAGFSVTGGTVQGAGAIKANVSIGGSGTTPTINVGDAGKAGLLSITGTYTQLSTATMNVSIGGTAVGTQYSQLKVSGTASLGGTLTAALINSFTPTVGQTFTILTAKSVSGTFTNTTIAINSSEHFAISYTSTGVVLTVVSGPASEATQPAAQTAVAAATRPASEVLKLVSGSSTLRHRVNTGMDQRIILASSGNSGDRHILPVGVGTNTLRVWDHVPVAPSWDHIRGVVVAQVPQSASLNAPHSDLSRHINNWQGQSQAVPVRAPLSGWAGVSATRLPVQTLKPSLPPVRW
jgi:hypothetical protein